MRDATAPSASVAKAIVVRKIRWPKGRAGSIPAPGTTFLNELWTNHWLDAGTAPTAPCHELRDVAGVAVAVFAQPEQCYVVEARCPCCARDLCEGAVSDGVLTCLCAAQFHLEDGAAVEASRPEGVRVYPAMTVDDHLYIHAPDQRERSG